MHIMKSHNIGLVDLTSSKDKLVTEDMGSCVTPSNIYIYKVNRLLKGTVGTSKST